ncbi:MAG: 8-oxoguanine deaminase [Actinobacteria bacterium]|nr:8-oxoguanine deaminase [Actinomycetota bacterium]MCI0678307.1 8-oxoguanine deaminase [Actinomycetota bacterium]
MPSLLIRNAHILVTMDGREIAGGGLYAVDGTIRAVGRSEDIPATADVVADLTGHLVLPGLVNTHHHLYQTLTRAFPGAQDVGLFDWLRVLYPVWARMTPDHVRVATRLGLVELALSGATTVFDHHYLWPNGSSLSDQVEGADGLVIRFCMSRGSMSLGESQGGLPPDSVVEDEEAILEDCRVSVERFHDPDSLREVVIAPCSPFSVTTGLMRESAELARDLGVRLHTHLAETRDEEEYCLGRFQRRPVAYMEDLGWAGPDVWYAHAVHVADDEVARMGAAGTGVSHCPTSNMRLGSGIAPVSRYLGSGVPVGLGVDGSASNDSSHLLAEVRQALLVGRLTPGPLMTARQALALATTGGARVLGHSDIGTLTPGSSADLIAIDLDRHSYAGALHDPVAAVLLSAPVEVDHSWVAGRRLVEDGRVVGVDIDSLVAEHNRLAADLAD